MSIRKFLLINLLLAIAITTTLTAIGNYYLDEKDIERHLDSLLAIATLSHQALLGDDLEPKRLTLIQKSLNDIALDIHVYTKHHYLPKPEKNYNNKFILQIWSGDKKLLLHSPNSPSVPLSDGHDGFSNKIIEGDLWRVFTAYNPSTKVSTMLAEHYDSRSELGHLIAQDDIYIMLLTFPLSGLLIWIIIGRGLSSLNRIAHEVSNRAPAHLEPVQEQGVPLEIKPVISELNNLFLRLQQAFDREKRFAADAAHELRTPLAALKTQAEVALKTSDPLEQETILKNVIIGANRCSHIVQQLLTMSRLVPEAEHIYETKKINLVKIAANIIAQLAPFALKKNTEIELESAKKVNLVIGDETALSILIRNLVDNAIRYTPKEGLIKVKIHEKKEHIVLTVSDNGPGIPAELRSRVFERFFRVLGNKSPGSGLGLAIVQQIAALHQADVKLGTPDNGVGLEITITFPNIRHRQAMKKN